MDIKNLEYFVTLANVLNYTKASELLFISQPTLSRHIAMLEEELDAKLFTRTTHQVELTPQGKGFLKEALKIVLTYRKSLANIKQTDKEPKKTLQIGYLRGGTEHLLVPIFYDFIEKSKNINLAFRDYNHIELIEALKNGTNDICFSMSTTLAGDDELDMLHLKDLKTVLVVRDDHPLADRKSVKLEDFKDEKYVYVKKGITGAWYDYVVSLYLSNGSTPNFSKSCDSVTTLLMLVALGYGITILTGTCELVAPRNLRFIELEDALSLKMVGGYLKSNTNSALIYLVDWLKETTLL